MIYSVAVALSEKGIPVDATTVSDELTRSNSLEKIGGPLEIVNLASAPPSTENATTYAKMIREKKMLRDLIERAEEIQARSYANEEFESVFDYAGTEILKLDERTGMKEYVSAEKIIKDVADEMEARSKEGTGMVGLKTGFEDLDSLLLGLGKSDMIVIGARPSMGKTAFALDIVRHVSFSGKTVLVFSLEMPELHIGQRILAQSSNVSLSKIKNGFAYKDQDSMAKIGVASEKISNSKLFVDDSSTLSVMQIRSKCRRLKKNQNALDLVVIDYLQLMEISGKKENMQQEISQISRSIKGLARELECPVVVLSQLSRGAEQRTNKMPQLSDLRDSGAIEQDADVVMFLHRDEYYDSDVEDKSLCKVKIGKNRNGETGVVSLTWQPEYTKFNSRTKDEKEIDEQNSKLEKQFMKNAEKKKENIEKLDF